MTTAAAPAPPAPRQVGTILIVDDHIDLAENLAEILAGAGMEAAIAGSAEAGLERIARGDVVALITDYRLPGRNGAELIAELRRQGNSMPAVVISAFTDDETIAHARTAGAAHVLGKPVDIERLTALVRDLGRDSAALERPVDRKRLLAWVNAAMERGAAERSRR